MPIRKGNVLRWKPSGVGDTLYTTDVFPGAMTALTNLIPDPTTDGLWVPRPAQVQLTDFTGFTTPGFVSCLFVIGNYAYGMIASARFAGKDEPFAFNLLTNTFATVTGVLNANTPTSPATSGAWQPPIMAQIGKYVVVTHPGFTGANGYFGWMDISNPASPAWNSGNCATNALPSPPTGVAQFTQRAYFICNPTGAQPAVLATDVLDPLTRTNGTYTLTFGDTQSLIAVAGLQLENMIQGGIVQSLMVFKSSSIWQITGDFAGSPSTIAVNALNQAVGTLAPNGICNTPNGLAFVAADGVRVIDEKAQVSDPIGDAGTGVTYPFKQALVPSRIVTACNGLVIRAVVQNGAALGSPFQEYWFDLSRKKWSGPHSFMPSLMWEYGNSFITCPIALTASLFSSATIPTGASTYTENGSVMQFVYQTANYPDLDSMSMYSIQETIVYMGYPTDATPFNVTFNDQNGSSLNAVNLVPPTTNLTQWNAFNWGQAQWLGAAGTALSPRRVPWTQPIVFSRGSLTVSGACAAGLQIGDVYSRVQKLNYVPPNG